MDILRLRARDIIDPETEAHYTYYSTTKATTGPHCHDFYEFFLITGGRVVHAVNGHREELEQGSLVFIRPEDIHYYISLDGCDSEFINIAFPQSTMESIQTFLGDLSLIERLFEPGKPPSITLSAAQMDLLKGRLDNLNLISFTDKTMKRMELRLLVLELLTKHFKDYGQYRKETVLSWLDELHYEMQKKENFTRGLDAVIERSGKSHEHICREFKKRFGVTLTEYTNNLKLNYAANLLVNTNTEICTIAFESGYESLSHFYHLFKRKFTVAPLKFRNMNKKTIIP